MVHGHRRENKYAREPGTWCGLLMLFSARDATPVAMMNDGRLQHDRVGAGAGLGAKYLAREDILQSAMIGSGGMARSYLERLCQCGPCITSHGLQPHRPTPGSTPKRCGRGHGIEVCGARTRAPQSSSRKSSAAAPPPRAGVLRRTGGARHVRHRRQPELVEPGSSGPWTWRWSGDATPLLEKAPPRPSSQGRLPRLRRRSAGRPRPGAAGGPDARDRDIPKLPTMSGGFPGRTARSRRLVHDIKRHRPQFSAVTGAVYERARDAGLAHKYHGVVPGEHTRLTVGSVIPGIRRVRNYPCMSFRRSRIQAGRAGSRHTPRRARQRSFEFRNSSIRPRPWYSARDAMRSRGFGSFPSCLRAARASPRFHPGL